LNDNLFTQFPPALLNATHLHSVSVRVVSFQTSRCSHSHCCTFQLANCRIAQIPPAIANLRALHSLTVRTGAFLGFWTVSHVAAHTVSLSKLSNNQVSSFPIELCSLDQLRKLDLSFNSFKHLPSAIGQMTSLIELRLEQTGLRELPVEIGSLQSLVILSVCCVRRC
jgi:Leucine-rich repeat (LRR) protein